MIGISFSRGWFSGSMLNFRGVTPLLDTATPIFGSQNLITPEVCQQKSIPNSFTFTRFRSTEFVTSHGSCRIFAHEITSYLPPRNPFQKPPQKKLANLETSPKNGPRVLTYPTWRSSNVRKGRRHGHSSQGRVPSLALASNPLPTPQQIHNLRQRPGAGEKVRSPISKAGNVTSFTKPLGGFWRAG